MSSISLQSLRQLQFTVYFLFERREDEKNIPQHIPPLYISFLYKLKVSLLALYLLGIGIDTEICSNLQYHWKRDEWNFILCYF